MKFTCDKCGMTFHNITPFVHTIRDFDFILLCFTCNKAFKDWLKQRKGCC